MTNTMIVDLQFGSTGKGLIAGYMATKNKPDTVITANGPNSGHIFIDGQGNKVKMRQLPVGVVSPDVKRIMIGPGAIIDPVVLREEIDTYIEYIGEADIIIHKNAAVVLDYDREAEKDLGRIGSTQTGTGSAMLRKMARKPSEGPSTASVAGDFDWGSDIMVVNTREWLMHFGMADRWQIEGCQGYSLSIHHGFWPYTTSRDCTPAQLVSDCGLPVGTLMNTNIIGCARTYPIRVNNKTGSSGPCYDDQKEISWADIGVEPELTTTTHLPRRIFTFSHDQLYEAMSIACPDVLFLNFANYMPVHEFNNLVDSIRYRVGFEGEIISGHGPTINDVQQYGGSYGS